MLHWCTELRSPAQEPAQGDAVTMQLEEKEANEKEANGKGCALAHKPEREQALSGARQDLSDDNDLSSCSVLTEEKETRTVDLHEEVASWRRQSVQTDVAVVTL